MTENEARKDDQVNSRDDRIWKSKKKTKKKQKKKQKKRGGGVCYIRCILRCAITVVLYL